MASVDYERHGRSCAQHRQAAPRIEARLRAVLGHARSVASVGAGTGSYEPQDRWVIAVEPSVTMRAQRRPDAAAVLAGVAGVAEALPLRHGCVDAALACISVPPLASVAQGLVEMRA